MGRALPLLLVSLLLSACGSKTGLNIPDVELEAQPDVIIPELCPPGEPVDLLFVIDNSQSMEEEQESLAAEIPALMDALVRPPDLDGDGLPEWNPVTNLHVGVVTTDLGIGNFRVGSCERPRGGDGILRNVGNPRDFDCLRAFPQFLSFMGDSSEDQLVNDLSCLVAVGDDGCGQEQPMEAALKALTPASSPLRFNRESAGVGDGPNDGFLRPDSFLTLVIVTDEDDCSVLDEDLFDPESERYLEHPNLRCYIHFETALHPVERFVDGFLALRGGDRDRIALSLIAGVPTDLASRGRETAFSEILTDPRMAYRIEGDEILPEPSCEVPERGVAFPPRRLVELARDLTPNSTVQSICQADFRPAGAAIAELIGVRRCDTNE